MVVTNREASNHIGCLVWCGITTLGVACDGYQLWSKQPHRVLSMMWLCKVWDKQPHRVMWLCKVLGKQPRKPITTLGVACDGYQLWSKQPHRVLSMMWNNHLRCTYDDYQLWNVKCEQATTSGDVVTKVMNVDVIDPWELRRGYIHSLNRSELDLDPRPLVLLPIV